MSGRAGRSIAAALALTLAATPAVSGRLEVVDGAGAVALAAPLGPDGRWCLVWNHSVTGIEVRDCFRADAGRLVLERSHQPDFAAGLGHIPGRGAVRSDADHGYWIEGIEAAMPEAGLPLRVGGPRVGHRLAVDGRVMPLPARLAGERVTIRLGEAAP